MAIVVIQDRWIIMTGFRVSKAALEIEDMGPRLLQDRHETGTGVTGGISWSVLRNAKKLRHLPRGPLGLQSKPSI